MNSRERVAAALDHVEPDRPPVDLGATATTGIQVSACAAVRRALGLDGPGDRVKVVEPFQMLGEVDADLRNALGVDCVGLRMRGTFFGYELADWKPWVTFDGTEVLVPGGFNTEPDANGDILQYPLGDRSFPASGRMPEGGFYFDAVIRQPPIDEATLRAEDNLEEYGPVGEEALSRLAETAERLWNETECAIIGGFAQTSFGDIALVPGTCLPNPKGIRDVEEWYVSTVTRPEHIREIFDRQCEIGIANLKRIHQAVGERVAAVFTTGTDFGAQNAPFISPDGYRDLFKPFHVRVNEWIHAETSWKSFMHTCGSIEPLIPDFIDAGFDILNPVQTSAAGMDPKTLKETYGDDVVFWGAGVDSQHTLPFGTVDEVRAEVEENLRVFAPGGGYVFNNIHNIQGGCPAENIIEMFRVAREWSSDG